MRRSAQHGIALVITLIMLAVVTLMAIVFLGISRRERTSVAVTADLTTARFMADTAVTRAQAEMISRIAAESNLFAYDYQVSTNFINPVGFQPALGSNLLNVSYTYADGTLLNADDLRRNLANLYYDPRPPVLIVTNSATGEQDFRFYVDLNRNSRFETNGLIVIRTNSLAIGTNFVVGEPEWIGVLEHPDQPHSPSNQFVGRYAFMTLPAGKSLDLNFIHNAAKNRARAPGPFLDAYTRNQGMGSWEINLAAFWQTLLPGYYTIPAYLYRPVGAASSVGDAFEDAVAVLNYRYGSMQNVQPAGNLFGSAFGSPNLFRTDQRDGYGDGFLPLAGVPPDPTVTMVDAYYPAETAANGDDPAVPWWGSDSPAGYYSPQELFDPSKITTDFVGRLRQASNTPQTTEYEYAFSRLLGQLGMDSHPANREKLHLHYLNVTNQGAVGDVIVPNLATNLVPWDRMRFFTNAAERMLRAQYGTGFREGIVIHPTNLYSAAVHRLFQLAANLADLQTNSAHLSDYPYFPSVYRPVFRRLGTNLVVGGFTEVTNDLFYTALPWIDLTATNVMARFPEENRDYHVNVFGIPTVVSARKGWPNFNEFHLQTSVQVTRRLEAYKPTVSSAPRLNQSYEIGISNLFGVESWNSYTQAFPRAVELVVTNLCTVALRDELRPLATREVSSRVVTNNYFTNITAGAWRAQEFSLASRVVQLVPNSEYWPLRTPPFRQLDGGIAFDETAGFPIPDFRLEITNRLTAVMLATDRSGAKRVVDFVNLDYLRGGMNITAGLVGRSNLFGERGLDAGSFWITNRLGNLPNGITFGITNQLYVSTNDVLAASDWRSLTENPVSGQQKQKAIDDFRLFMGLPALFDTRRVQPPAGPRVQVPFSPSRILDQNLSWQVNDPLVHYHVDDLHDEAYTSLENIVVRPPGAQPEPSNLGKLNERYRPWGAREGDPWLRNPGVKDPLVRRSDDWDFPTNQLPTLGWLGRVHRGTPWQTFYLKSAAEPVERWSKWSGRRDTHPTNDWWLVDLFTTAPNDNAARGLLGVNQTNLAAWAAVLSGVPVMSNTVAISKSGRPSYSRLFIEPNTPQLRTIVESINLARQQQSGRSYRRLGHVLAAPALTLDSPYLNRSDDARENGLNDTLYEWIPQQILSLLKEDEPYVVVYAYGQSLRPADRSIVTAPGAYQGMCTNYQITGEVLTKTAVRFQEVRRPNEPLVYKAIVESYDVLPTE